MTKNRYDISKGAFLSVSPLQNKVFYLSLSFFAVLAITYFVMSGAFLRHKWALAFFALLIVVCLVILCAVNRKNIKGAATVFLLVFLAFAMSYITYTRGYVNAQNVVSFADGRVHAMSGYVTEKDSDNLGNIFVEITEIDGNELKIPVLAQGYNYTGYYLKEGAYLEFDGKLRSVTQKDDGFYYEWLKAHGVYAKLYSMKNTETDSDKNKISVISGVKNFFGGSMLETLKIIPGKERFERAYSISTAMMFGDKSKLEDGIYDDFTKSGIIHILCVSGLHFSVMLGGLSVVLKYLCKNRKIRNILLVAVSVLYLIMCGFARSAFRAAVMAFIAAAGVTGSRKNYCTHSLLLAVCIICIFDPAAVFDGGFRMSCICCTGILCSSSISETLCARLRYHPVICCIASSFLVSFSASAFLFPYSIFAFDGVSTVSALSSTFAVIPAQLLLICCWLASFICVIDIGFVRTIFASVIAMFSDFICAIADFFAGLRYSYITVELPDASFWAFMVIMAVAALVTGSKKRAASVYIYIVSVSAVATAALLVAGN